MFISYSDKPFLTQEKYKPRTLCGTQSKNFHARVRKVSLKNTATRKIKSLTSSLDLCVPTKLAQITVLEASKMKQKSSMTDRVHQNRATVKNVKRYQPVKNAVLRWNLIVQEIIFQKSFSQKCLRNHFLVSTFLFGIQQLFCLYCNKIFLICI